jgi:imidazolonepropionase-like amidohydrolase
MFESQFGTEHLKIIVAEASQHGLRVAAHAHGADAITSATEAGVATIEHCGWMTGPGTFDRREHVARQMAAKNIYACAALNQDWLPFYHRLGERADGVFGRFTWMDGLGVPFISGTDAGLPGSVFDNYAGALGLYPWLGFPHERTIEFATVNAADALGLSQTTGRIAQGLAADLLVVDGDPLTSLDVLYNVQLVVTPNLLHVPAANA